MENYVASSQNLLMLVKVSVHLNPETLTQSSTSTSRSFPQEFATDCHEEKKRSSSEDISDPDMSLEIDQDGFHDNMKANSVEIIRYSHPKSQGLKRQRDCHSLPSFPEARRINRRNKPVVTSVCLSSLSPP